MTLNLIVPTCWQELTQKQLRYVYYLIAQGFSQTAVQTYCLCRWAGLEIICPEGDGYRVRHAYNIHHINAEQLTEVLSRIDWLNRLSYRSACRRYKAVKLSRQTCKAFLSSRTWC